MLIPALKSASSSDVTIFGWWDIGSTVQGLLTIPEFIWEAFLGIYCAIWGFRRDAPILRNWSPSHQQLAMTGDAV